jgi:hypothetical protein
VIEVLINVRYTLRGVRSLLGSKAITRSYPQDSNQDQTPTNTIHQDLVTCPSCISSCKIHNNLVYVSLKTQLCTQLSQVTGLRISQILYPNQLSFSRYSQCFWRSSRLLYSEPCFLLSNSLIFDDTILAKRGFCWVFTLPLFSFSNKTCCDSHQLFGELVLNYDSIAQSIHTTLHQKTIYHRQVPSILTLAASNFSVHIQA